MSYAYLLPYESEALPLSLKMYLAVDWATMETEQGKRDPDYTEIGVAGMDSKGDIWMVDWWYKQCETDVGIKALIRLIGIYKPLRCFHEGGLIDKAIGPAIRDAMRRAQRYTSMEALPAIGDKAIKLQAFHARATARTVHFPLRKAWADHVIDQLCRFPGGKHDDAADACGLLGRGVDKMMDAHLPSAPPKDILVPFSTQWLEWSDQSDKPKVRYY